MTSQLLPESSVFHKVFLLIKKVSSHLGHIKEISCMVSLNVEGPIVTLYTMIAPSACTADYMSTL